MQYNMQQMINLDILHGQIQGQDFNKNRKGEYISSLSYDGMTHQ